MSNLLQRILTAAIAGPIFLLLIWLGGWWLMLLMLGCSCMAFFELHELYHRKGVGHSVAWVLPFVILLPLAAGVSKTDFLSVFGTLSFGWFLLLLLRELFSSRSSVLVSLGAAVLTGVLACLPFASVVALDTILHPAGLRNLLLLVVLSTWVMDSAAYFGGINFGRHKLFERVSPKKTVEGFLFGIVGALMSGALAGLLMDSIPLRAALIATGLVGVFGPLGDLLESRLKRDAGAKDSSTLLPGHGGLLDRFDSWIFVMPALYLLCSSGLLLK